MRVAVTGASGFIGRAVALKLLSDGHKVYSYGRTDPEIDNVTHSNEWGYDKKINAIVHCSARTDEWTTTPEDHDDLVGTNNSLTKNAMSINPKARFILMSSDLVYQSSDTDFSPVEEFIDTETRYVTAYALSKSASELIVKEERTVVSNGKESPSYYILRASTVYGSGDRSFLPKIEHLGHGAIILPGRTNPSKSFLNIESLVNVVSFFVDDYAGNHFGIYNVADHSPVSTHSMILDILNARQKPNTAFRIPFKFAYKAAEGVEKRSRKKGTLPYLTRQTVLEWGRDNPVSVNKLELAMGEAMPETDISSADSWENGISYSSDESGVENGSSTGVRDSSGSEE